MTAGAGRTAPQKHNGLIVGEWSALTAVAALVATLVEGFLLERKIGLVTGGFLADIYLESATARVWFLVVSFVGDAALLGMIVAFVLWICALLQLRPAGRILFTLGFALLPVAWFDVVSYQIAQYLGDIFNVGVLFELSGRSVSEFLAVAGPQIAALFALLVAGVAAIFGVAWLLNRFVPLIEGDDELRWSRGRLVAKLALLLFVCGLVFTTMARLAHETVERGMARKASGVFVGRIVQFTTDVDRDGYGLLSRPPDPAPFNAAIHPYAIEIPGNGIDENGIGGDLPIEYARYEEGPSEAPRFVRTPPVVFVILESFRADVIFSERDGREVTPFLNRLARDGTFTDEAYSHNGWTQQSRYHLFTGSLAGPRGRTSLIDDFNANGYETAFFSAQDESDDGHLDVGFRRATVSFDARQAVDERFSTSTTPGSLAIPHSVVEREVERFLTSRDTNRPLFLHLNFQETHFPYGHDGVEPILNEVRLTARQIVPARRADLRAMYDNSAANVDAAVARMVALVTQHTGETPLVVAIADHGESLLEDGFLGHGVALSDVQTRVPLIVSEVDAPISVPFGQSDLRDLLWCLLGDGGEYSPEAWQDDKRHSVFQYMGDMRTARQLASVTRSGRLRLDIHDRMVDPFTGHWVPMDDVAEDVAREVKHLIYFWESLVLAGSPGMRR